MTRVVGREDNYGDSRPGGRSGSVGPTLLEGSNRVWGPPTGPGTWEVIGPPILGPGDGKCHGVTPPVLSDLSDKVETRGRRPSVAVFDNYRWFLHGALPRLTRGRPSPPTPSPASVYPQVSGPLGSDGDHPSRHSFLQVHRRRTRVLSDLRRRVRGVHPSPPRPSPLGMSRKTEFTQVPTLSRIGLPEVDVLSFGSVSLSFRKGSEWTSQLLSRFQVRGDWSLKNDCG